MLELDISILLKDMVLEEGIVTIIEDYIGDDTIVIDNIDPAIEYLLKHKYDIDIFWTKSSVIGIGGNILFNNSNTIEYPFLYKNFDKCYFNYIKIRDVDTDKLFKDLIVCGYIIKKSLFSFEFFDRDINIIRGKKFIKTFITKN